MVNTSTQLTELVRILEEQNFVFSADPLPITQSLRQVEENNEQKLIRRANMIDRDGSLQDALDRTNKWTLGLWVLAMAFMFVSGFSATFMLMSHSGLNFFFILASVLGMNTLMLLVWLFSIFLHVKFSHFVSNPATWWRGKDQVNQAMWRLYSDEWRQPITRWRIGRFSHTMWLTTLSGMLISIVLLLLVRQYTFNWESTLLSNDASTKVISLLSWLPAQFGFPVPDAQVVLNGRMSSNISDARAWSGLLMGSILCYGIFPRLIAWILCQIFLKRSHRVLSLDKPYYQKIIQQWQTKIIDADIHKEAINVVAPKISLSNGLKWAVMLEMVWSDHLWYRNTLGQEWLDKGVIDSRDKITVLLEELKNMPVQLLIGVRAHTVPDRGILRQITQLAEAAQGDVLVQLLLEKQITDEKITLLQWQQALNERNIAWLNPPRVSQEARLQPEAV